MTRRYMDWDRNTLVYDSTRPPAEGQFGAGVSLKDWTAQEIEALASLRAGNTRRVVPLAVFLGFCAGLGAYWWHPLSPAEVFVPPVVAGAVTYGWSWYEHRKTLNALMDTVMGRYEAVTNKISGPRPTAAAEPDAAQAHDAPIDYLHILRIQLRYAAARAAYRPQAPRGAAEIIPHIPPPYHKYDQSLHRFLMAILKELTVEVEGEARALVTGGEAGSEREWYRALYVDARTMLNAIEPLLAPGAQLERKIDAGLLDRVNASIQPQSRATKKRATV